MPIIRTVVLSLGVESELLKLPRGEISGYVDNVLREHFELNPIDARAFKPTKRRVRGEEKYPIQEITIDDL